MNNWLVISSVENGEKCLSWFAKSEVVMFKKLVLCSSSSQKPRGIQFTLVQDEENH